MFLKFLAVVGQYDKSRRVHEPKSLQIINKRFKPVVDIENSTVVQCFCIFNILGGQNIGMIVMMGIIMLLGIVVNAAILIMDYTQQLREQGKTTKEALLEASPTKFKPILMSAVAIIFGMLPMALGIGDAGAEMRQPLGIVSIGGIIVSTIMTLYVIPAMYFLTTKRNVKQIEKV